MERRRGAGAHAPAGGGAAAWLRAVAAGGVLGAGASGTAEAAEDDAEAAARGLLATRLAQPPLTSPIDGPNAQFTLQSTTTDRTVTARVGFQLDDTALGDLLVDLKLSGPISSSGETRLADLDGLRNSTTADIGVGWIRWRPAADPAAQAAICAEYQRTLRPEDAGNFTCSLLNLPPDSDYRRRFRRAIDWGTPLIVRFRYRVGQRNFHWADRATLDPESTALTQHSITAAAGVLFDAVGLVALAYRYESAYQAEEVTELCRPLGASGALACDPAQLGPPGRREAHVLQAEIRRYFREMLGFNPRVSYEFRRQVVGLELPIYFLRDPDRGLNGGVTLGWRSDDDQLLLSVFVGEALRVMP